MTMPRLTHAASHGPAKSLWLPEVALLLLFFGTRLFRLADLPPHIDEVFHVYRARDVWGLHPLYFIYTTKLLNIWLIALFYPFAASYWVARIVSVFSSLVTLACAYKIGSLLHSRAAGLLAGYLYLVLPLTFWHDRLAVSDPVSTATGALVVLSSLLLVRRPKWRYAALVGLALALAYLAKLTMLLLWPVPLLAWLLLRSGKRLAWPGMLRVGGAYAIGLALASPIVGYSFIHSDLGAHQIANRSQIDATLLARLLQNTGRLLANTRTYAGVVVLLWLALAVVMGFASRKRIGQTLLLTLAAGLPLAALLAVGTRNDTRYYLVGLPTLLPLMGIGGALAWGWLRRSLPDIIPGGAWSLAGGLALVGLAVAYWPFFGATYADPATLTSALPTSDYWTYINGYPAGYGWDEATAHLRQMAQQSDHDMAIVAPVEGHAWRTQIALTGLPDVTVFQPEPLEADWLAGQLAGEADVYFVREEPRPDIDWASLGANAELVDRFPKPGGENWVELRHLTPAPEESEAAS